MPAPVLQRHNLWVLILLKTQRNFKLEEMFSMGILIMMPVVKLLQKHSWAKPLLLLRVKTIQIVIVMILGLIFVWNGVLIH